MAMRVTGMYSGLDTETIIHELVAAKQTKVDKIKKEQTTLEWKQDAWKDLNNKIKKLFDGTLSNLRYQSSFMKKTTNVSNSNLVSIITSDSAMNSVQSLKIKHMAKAGYLTGGEMKATDGKGALSSGSNVSRLGIEAGSKFEVNVGGKVTDIEIDENTTISNLVSKLQSAGVNANFDAANQRLFIGATDTGNAHDFTITASNEKGMDALSKLGIMTFDEKSLKSYQAYADLASDADARDAAVQNQVNALLKSYTAERKNLLSSNDKLAESQDKLKASYEEKFADSGVDITDADERTDRINTLNAAIESANATLERDDATEEEKEAARKAIADANSELSYLNSYEKNADAVKNNNDRIAELERDYLEVDAEGNVQGAGASLTAEAENYVQGKIDQAVEILGQISSGALKASDGAARVVGQDAEIELNGAKFTSATNTFEINGLTITCKGETAEGEEITLTTESDTSGIYDMVKNFIKEYSELINEMDKLYNAESTRGYDPLTDDEKDAMSDKEIEKWEEKIKGSLLRRDSTLNTVASAMREIMASGFSVGGKTMYLSDFGIETLGYFNAADNEKNAYHINGDEDDDAVKNKENTLMAMIRTDPDSVVSFFTQLSQKLYGKLNDLMKGTEYSSAYTVYDDKKMKEDYEKYKTKISEAEKKLQAYEDKWYKKFSAMETAMAKLQSNANAVTSLLGGS